MDFQRRYVVIPLKEGFCKNETQGVKCAGAASTLVLGPHNILVGTGLPYDKELLLNGLKQNGVTAENIEYVICPQSTAGYIGNLNLFTNSTFIIGFEVMRENKFVLHDFKEGIPFEIDDEIEVIPTPGHVSQGTTVMVKNTQYGVAALTGGTFEFEDDLEDSDLWRDNSEDPDTQEQSRITILKTADVIFPRHGQMFRVPELYKGEMKIVMTP